VSSKQTKRNSSSQPLARYSPLSTPHFPLLPVAAIFVVYLILALWFPLIPHYRQAPPADIRTFAPSLAAGLLYGLLLLLLFVLHLWACREVGRQAEPPRLRTLLLVALLFSLPLLLTYPMNATDVYRYVIRGRISSVYGVSPHVVPPERFTNDPFLPLAGEWAGETSPYGPLWEAVAAGFTAMSGDNLLSGILLFKGLGLVCFLGTAALLWLLLPSYRSSENSSRKERQGAKKNLVNFASLREVFIHSDVPAHADSSENVERLSNLPGKSLHKPFYTALWAWNPFLLLTFVVNGHNDALMLLWLLLGLWIARRGWPTGGFLVMVLAPLTKPVALLALPFFFLAIWKSRPSGRERLRFAILSLVGASSLAVLAFAPWIGRTPTGSALSSTLGLLTRLAREAGAGASFSPATLLWFGGQLLPGQPLSLTIIGGIAQALFVLFFLWLLWRVWRGRSAARSTADIFIAYLLQALNFRIWYAVWPFPWLLLDGARRSPNLARPLRFGLWFLLTSQLSVIIYGHVRVHLLGGEHAYAHLIGVPFTFLLPFLLAQLPASPYYSILHSQSSE
jgi:hypothetical protein